ncbi:hypothetical protein C8R47DRAFT_1101427 [Mycena vitilis]|nr:hypothetical protein C8R47DRAFT_1101427 [Mycena vitilis]
MRAGWRTRVPWYLVHVCQFWRRCALSYPSLWSFITIPPSYPHSSRHFPSLEAQLTHSADAALDLYFPSVDMGTETRVLDLILRNCTRWRSLHLRDASDSGWPSPVVLRKLKWLLPVAGRLNQLEKLSASESLIIPNFFSVAPNLHKIHGRFHSSVALPWAQITHYRQSSFPDVHARILTAAPNLQECALIFTYDHILPDAMPDAMITLPHLRRFSSLDMSAFPSKFLDHLTAPLLQDLIICDGSLAVIPPFVHRSSCTLKRLALARCADLGPEIIDILRGLPSLESLVLEKSQDDNDEQKHVDVFNALTVSGNASDICPNLTSLVFGWNRSTKFIPRADNTFFNMVRSRFNRTLRHSFRLRVLAEYYNSNRISREITALQKEGFDAEFLKHGDPEMITDL